MKTFGGDKETMQEEAEVVEETTPVEEAAPIQEEPAAPPAEEAPITDIPPPPPPPRLKRKRASTQKPYIETPSIDNEFWMNLLQTQRAMERDARGSRWSSFSIV
jgi:type IV secretory pathway VirB10-like protein